MSHVPPGSVWLVLVASLGLGGTGLGCSASSGGAPADASTSERPAGDVRNDAIDAGPSGDGASEVTMPPVDASADVPPVDASADVVPVDASADVPPVDASADVPPGEGGLWWASAPARDVAGAATLDTLAIAYVEAASGSSASPEGRLMLQLLDGQLQPRGGLTEIDRQPIAAGGPPIASVATDGDGFVVCWSPTDQIRCLEVRGGRAASLLIQTAGAWPAIAFRGQTWAVAYVTSPTRSQMSEARVTTFSREGLALVTSASFPYDAYFERPVSFVGTPSGFALLAGQGTLTLTRLTPELAVQGLPVDTGVSPWAFRSLAATDGEAAMGLAQPYGNILLHLRGSEVVLRQERGCPSKTGCGAAVAWQQNTFAVAWWSAAGSLSYFADVDHAGVAGDQLADASSIVIVPFGSHTVLVGKGVP